MKLDPNNCSTKSAQDPIHLTQHIITLHNKPLIDMVDQYTYVSVGVTLH